MKSFTKDQVDWSKPIEYVGRLTGLSYPADYVGTHADTFLVFRIVGYYQYNADGSSIHDNGGYIRNVPEPRSITSRFVLFERDGGVTSTCMLEETYKQWMRDGKHKILGVKTITITEGEGMN